MKKKLFTTTIFALIATLVVTGLGYMAGSPQNVYAQSTDQTTKTATRTEVKVAVGGKTSQIVAYNIDGYNYFRVADLCKVLDMKVFPYVNDLGDGIKIVSTDSFDGSVEAAPIEKSLTVTLKDLNVYYDGGYIKGNCFNLGNRNYIKLADVVAAANSNYAIKLASAQKHAKNGTGQAITSRPTTTNLKTSFSSSTNTITITATKTDFQKLYEELYIEEQGKPPVEATKEEISKKAVAQPKLTQAPEVGTMLANIMKDENKPAYIDGKPNYDNITEPYATASAIFGQCTWYVRGRFAEVFGIAYPYGESVYDVDSISKNELLKVIKEPHLIEAQSIAIFGTVHVLFVEYVEHDSQGNPKYIYFTEGNVGQDGMYKPDKDGRVKKLAYDDFINRQSTYKGCITIK